MKLGIIAYPSPSGLGIQSLDYYRFLKPAKTMLVDLSPLNGYPTDTSKFTDDQIGEIQYVKGLPQPWEIASFCENVDVILFPETPLNPYFINCARERGIKTIQHFNYEFLDYWQNPAYPKPDVLLAPSLWHFSEMQHYGKQWGCEVKYLPVGVNRQLLPYRPRTQIKTFLHVAGHATAEDRNGTELLHESIKRVRNPDVRFIIRAQRKITTLPSDRRVTIVVDNVPNYADLYNEGDCFILPRRYGGLCLPLNEAVSTGMIPLTTNLEPQNLWLPSDCLMTAHLVRIIYTHLNVAVYETPAVEIAAHIDALAKLEPSEVAVLSAAMKTIGDQISWSRLVPYYEKLFNDTVSGVLFSPPNRNALEPII